MFGWFKRRRARRLRKAGVGKIHRSSHYGRYLRRQKRKRRRG